MSKYEWYKKQFGEEFVRELARIDGIIAFSYQYDNLDELHIYTAIAERLAHWNTDSDGEGLYADAQKALYAYAKEELELWKNTREHYLTHPQDLVYWFK